MATINHLPDELLIHIARILDAFRRQAYDGLSVLETPARRKTRNHVLSFCLTSKRFLNVREEILYSFFVNDSKEDMRGPRLRRDFLNQLTIKPRLAKRVSEMCLGVLVDFANCSSTTRRNRRSYLDLEDEHSMRLYNTTFSSSAHSLGIAHKLSLVNEIETGNADAELCLLMFHATILETLTLYLPEKKRYLDSYWHFRELLNQMAEGASRNAGPLRTLRILRIFFNPDSLDSLGFPVAFLRNFLFLPSLRQFECHRVTTKGRRSMEDFGTVADVYSAWPDRTSSVKEITITDAYLSHDSISRILRSCTALESFSCIWDTARPTSLVWHLSSDGNISIFNRHVHETLALHRDSISSITLVVSPKLRHLDFHPFPSLKPFCALRHLKISAFLLTGSMRINWSTVVNNNTGHPVREGKPQPPQDGYHDLADVFPEGLRTLAIFVSTSQLDKARYHTAKFLAPLVIEVSRGIASGERLQSLRLLHLDGWSHSLPTDVVWEICELLDTTQVILKLDNVEYEPEVLMSRLLSQGKPDYW